jgi:serine/threonine-protein kinase HipA
MHKLKVIYNGWGERWTLGSLAFLGGAGSAIGFEYSAQAIERGLQLSPLRQPLPRPGAVPTAFKGEPAFAGLPGFIADALPDGWGMLLMDRALRRAGRDPRSVTVLERLALIGDRAMGALSFEPAVDGLLPEEILALDALAHEVTRIQVDTHADADAASVTSGDAAADEKLRRLLLLGGSPQGARPKVLVNFDPTSGQVSSGAVPPVGAHPWLVKFPAQGEHREVSAIEALYARVARAGGMDMTDSQFFDLAGKHSAFGVARFDRTASPDKTASQWRIPLLSLSALLQADFRVPSLDYETVLLATQRITGDTREVLKAFERCVFNVLVHNRDDHSRNFAYRLDEQGLWKLSPAFDLTYSFGPGGEHSTSVAGHGKHITRQHLLQVAKAGGVNVTQAQHCIDHWVSVVRGLPALIGQLPIRRPTGQKLVATLTGLCDLVEGA